MESPPTGSIVIADDHAVVREGLKVLLEAEPDLVVVGEASDPAETYALLGPGSALSFRDECPILRLDEGDTLPSVLFACFQGN